MDVFASRPHAGNPLSLVPDADGLDESQMRAIAREFNQSETTFLLRPSLPGATWRLRSIPPIGAEVAGAGHNALGAWLRLAASGRLPPASAGPGLAQEIGGQVLPVEVIREEQRPVAVSMDQSPPQFGASVSDRRELAASSGLTEDDLVADEAAQVVSTGAGHLLVPVRDRTAVDRAVPDAPRLAAALRQAGAEGCYLYSPDPVDTAGAVAYTRFFNPAMGIWEDPATGTAAGPLVARLVASGKVPDDTTAIVEQGGRGGPRLTRMLAIWLNSYMAESEASVFRALADPTRRQILQDLRDGEMAAGDIASRFPIKGPSVSRHLSILKGAGLVTERRDGNRILYALAGERLALCVGGFLSAVCPEQVVLRHRTARERS